MQAADRDPKDDYPLPPSVKCPFCHEADTQVESPFGGGLSVAQYYCRRCRTVFDWVKWEKENGE